MSVDIFDDLLSTWLDTSDPFLKNEVAENASVLVMSEPNSYPETLKRYWDLLDDPSIATKITAAKTLSHICSTYSDVRVRDSSLIEILRQSKSAGINDPGIDKALELVQEIDQTNGDDSE